MSFAEAYRSWVTTPRGPTGAVDDLLDQQAVAEYQARTATCVANGHHRVWWASTVQRWLCSVCGHTLAAEDVAA